jgi:hypothetical protein
MVNLYLNDSNKIFNKLVCSLKVGLCKWEKSLYNND